MAHGLGNSIRHLSLQVGDYFEETAFSHTIFVKIQNPSMKDATGDPLSRALSQDLLALHPANLLRCLTPTPTLV